MSDDDYVYDSPYDDVYDLFDDADPAPELADDLAERAVYSPVWQHTHTGELKDYFSDWDDHSDDYWDDDPRLLNNGDNDGSSTKFSKINAQKSIKRGRKRKLSEAREKPVTIAKNVEALQATLRGPVWKKESPILVNDYTKGSDKPTALRLSDSVMRSAYNKTQGFGKGALKGNDSWANDLSLADMGLRQEATTSGHHNGKTDEDADADPHADEEEDEIDADSDLDRIDSGLTEHALDDSTSESAARRLAGRKRSQALEDSASPNLQSISDGSIEEREPRKRRKKIAVAEKSKEKVLPSPGISMVSGIFDKSLNTDDSTALKSRGQERKSPEGASQSLASQDTIVRDDQEHKLAYNSRGRKRKLSSESSASEIAAKNRVKRSAASAVSR